VTKFNTLVTFCATFNSRLGTRAYRGSGYSNLSRRFCAYDRTGGLKASGEV